jgi:hypothetical protein
VARTSSPDAADRYAASVGSSPPLAGPCDCRKPPANSSTGWKRARTLRGKARISASTSSRRCPGTDHSRRSMSSAGNATSGTCSVRPSTSAPGACA